MRGSRSGMIHRPSLLMSLTPEEILMYWSLLSPEQQGTFVDEKLAAFEEAKRAELAPSKPEKDAEGDGEEAAPRDRTMQMYEKTLFSPTVPRVLYNHGVA